MKIESPNIDKESPFNSSKTKRFDQNKALEQTGESDGIMQKIANTKMVKAAMLATVLSISTPIFGNTANAVIENMDKPSVEFVIDAESGKIKTDKLEIEIDAERKRIDDEVFSSGDTNVIVDYFTNVYLEGRVRDYLERVSKQTNPFNIMLGVVYDNQTIDIVEAAKDIDEVFGREFSRKIITSSLLLEPSSSGEYIESLEKDGLQFDFSEAVENALLRGYLDNKTVPQIRHMIESPKTEWLQEPSKVLFLLGTLHERITRKTGDYSTELQLLKEYNMWGKKDGRFIESEKLVLSSCLQNLSKLIGQDRISYTGYMLQIPDSVLNAIPDEAKAFIEVEMYKKTYFYNWYFEHYYGKKDENGTFTGGAQGDSPHRIFVELYDLNNSSMEKFSETLTEDNFPIKQDSFDVAIESINKQLGGLLTSQNKDVYPLISIEKKDFNLVFYSNEFQNTLKQFTQKDGVIERTHMNAISLAIAVWRYAEKDKQGNITPEEIERVTQFTLETQENTKNVEVMGPNTDANIMTHQDLSFDNEVLKRVCEDFGCTVKTSVRGMKIDPTTGENRNKTAYLEAIATLKDDGREKLIIAFTHGSENLSAFSGNYTGNTIKVADSTEWGINPKELAEVIMKSPLAKAGKLNKIKIMLLECHVYLFMKTVGEIQDKMGYIGPKPYVINSSNSGQISFGYTDGGDGDIRDTFLVSFMKKAKKRIEKGGENKLLLGDFYGAETGWYKNYKYEPVFTGGDPALIVPVKIPIKSTNKENGVKPSENTEETKWIHLEIGGVNDGSDMAGAV